MRVAESAQGIPSDRRSLRAAADCAEPDAARDHLERAPCDAEPVTPRRSRLDRVTVTIHDKRSRDAALPVADRPGPAMPGCNAENLRALSRCGLPRVNRGNRAAPAPWEMPGNLPESILDDFIGSSRRIAARARPLDRFDSHGWMIQPPSVPVGSVHWIRQPEIDTSAGARVFPYPSRFGRTAS